MFDLRCFALALVFAAPTAAQLSGTYTLDPKGSGSRNFKSFLEATFVLTRDGVKAPVTIEVADGTYTGASDRWTITAFAGMGRGGEVTFKSKSRHGAVIRSDLWTRIGGRAQKVTHVALDGFRFVSSSTSSAIGLNVYDNSGFLEIANCHFDGVQFKLDKAHDIDVHHCLFSSTHRVTRQLYVENIDNLSVHHNEFRVDNAFSAIRMYHYSSRRTRTRIYNNIVWGAPARNSYAILDLWGVAETQIDSNTLAISSANSWDGALLRINGYPGTWNHIRNNVFYSESKYSLLRINPHLPYHHFFANNLYWGPNANYLVSYPVPNKPSINYASLAAWQRWTGQDPTGIQADPKLVNVKTAPFQLRLGPDSPARAKARGVPAWVDTDYTGAKRQVPTSIGAYERTPEFTLFGKGCAGTNNLVPKLAASSPLRLGQLFKVLLSNASPRANRAFLIVGASRDSWGSTRLPLPLGGGCNLLVAPHAIVPLNVLSGTSFFTMRIPGNLPNERAFFQWGVVDPAAGGIGIAMSEAGMLTF